MLDPVIETLAIVRCMVDNGALKNTKEVCEAVASVAASIVDIAKGVKPVAAVGVAEYRDAEKAGGVACLECGEVVQALGAHVMKAHGMNWTAYAAKWKGWADDCGVELRKASAALSAKRRDNAIMLGLGVVADKQKPKKVEEAKPAAPAMPAQAVPEEEDDPMPTKPDEVLALNIAIKMSDIGDCEIGAVANHFKTTTRHVKRVLAKHPKYQAVVVYEDGKELVQYVG